MKTKAHSARLNIMSDDALATPRMLLIRLTPMISSETTSSALPIRTRIEGPRPGAPACLVAEPSRATALLKWQPTMSDLNTIHSIGVGLAEKVSPRISPRSDRKVIPTFWPAVGFGGGRRISPSNCRSDASASFSNLAKAHALPHVTFMYTMFTKFTIVST